MLFLDDAQHTEVSQHSHSTVGSKSSVRALSAAADLTCPAQPQVGPPAPAQERYLHSVLSLLSFPERCCKCTYAVLAQSTGWTLDLHCRLSTSPVSGPICRCSWRDFLDEAQTWFTTLSGLGLLMEPVITTPTLPTYSDLGHLWLVACPCRWNSPALAVPWL